MDSTIKHHPHSKGKPEVAIRTPVAEDAIAITRLARALAEYEGVSCRLSSADITMLLSQPDFYYLRVAEAEGRIVAFIFAYPGYDLSSASHGYHLADIFVAESHRQLGVGKTLLDNLQTHTHMQGGHWVSFAVLRNNENAKEFYRKMDAQAMPVDFYALGIKNPYDNA